MNISKASQISGVSADTFRYYEKIGLVPIVERTRVMRLKIVNDDSQLLKKEKERKINSGRNSVIEFSFSTCYYNTE